MTRSDAKDHKKSKSIKKYETFLRNPKKHRSPKSSLNKLKLMNRLDSPKMLRKN